MGIFEDKEKILAEAKMAEEQRKKIWHEQHLATKQTHSAMQIFVEQHLPEILREYIQEAHDAHKKIIEFDGKKINVYYIGATISNLYDNTYAGWYISEQLECCKETNIVEMTELKYYFLAILPYVYNHREPLIHHESIDDMVVSLNIKFKEYLIKLICKEDAGQ